MLPLLPQISMSRLELLRCLLHLLLRKVSPSQHCLATGCPPTILVCGAAGAPIALQDDAPRFAQDVLRHLATDLAARAGDQGE